MEERGGGEVEERDQKGGGRRGNRRRRKGRAGEGQQLTFVSVYDRHAISCSISHIEVAPCRIFPPPQILTCFL